MNTKKHTMNTTGRLIRWKTSAGLFIAVAITFFVGCDKDEKGAEVSVADVAVSESSVDGAVHETGVIGVDVVAKDPNIHAGEVAVKGVVAQVLGKRGAFTIIDADEFASCGTTTCALNYMPVSVPTGEFEGELPKHKETVVAFGKLEPLKKGYEITVEKVMRDGETILSRIKASDEDGVQPANPQVEGAGVSSGSDQIGGSYGLKRPTSEE